MKLKKIALLVGSSVLFIGSGTSALAATSFDLTTQSSAQMNMNATVDDLTFVRFDKPDDITVVPLTVATGSTHLASRDPINVLGCWYTNSGATLALTVSAASSTNGNTLIGGIPDMTIVDGSLAASLSAADSQACDTTATSGSASTLFSFKHTLDRFDTVGSYGSIVTVSIAAT